MEWTCNREFCKKKQKKPPTIACFETTENLDGRTVNICDESVWPSELYKSSFHVKSCKVNSGDKS
jgi:hypothetical protein